MFAITLWRRAPFKSSFIWESAIPENLLENKRWICREPQPQLISHTDFGTAILAGSQSWRYFKPSSLNIIFYRTKAYRKGLLPEKEKSMRLKMLTSTKGNVFKIPVMTQKNPPKHSIWWLKIVIKNRTAKKIIWLSTNYRGYRKMSSKALGTEICLVKAQLQSYLGRWQT